MSLYTIGDLHLSLSTDKPMDVFGDKWKDHTAKIKAGFAHLSDDDVTVICGDISWGMSLEEALADLRFIDTLPGHKIILKGNHDYWWNTATKINKFFTENGINTIEILHNNCFFYENTAICGTRGWFYEEEKGIEHDRKIMLREVGRLERSLKLAGEREKTVFLHYPPKFLSYECPEILELLKEHSVRHCYYGHIHGKGCAAAFNTWADGTQFRLVSADFVDFTPVKIL